MENQLILCCEAKVWALVIGWLQMTGSLVTLSFGIIGMVDGHILLSLLGVIPINELENIGLTADDALFEARVISTVLIVSSIFGALIATLLIVGVKQGSVRKIKIWGVIQMIMVILSTIGLLSTLIYGPTQPISVVSSIAGILVNSFFWWVVNVHLNELRIQMQSRFSNIIGNPQFGPPGSGQIVFTNTT